MGQAVSRRVVVALDKGMERARSQMDKQMKDNIKKDKYGFSDPNAAIGFTRGMDEMIELTPEQEEEIQKRNEMPPDLIKFLNDAGPVKRAVHSELSSPRLRESLQATVVSGQQRTGHDDRRTVRDMPLLGTTMDFVTSRTTNFSNLDLDDRDESTGLTALQMYVVLTSDVSSKEIWNSPEIQDEIDRNTQSESIIESCRKYLEVPVVLRDEEMEYLGLPQKLVDVTDLLDVSLQPARGVKLVLLQQLERKKDLESKPTTNILL